MLSVKYVIQNILLSFYNKKVRKWYKQQGNKQFQVTGAQSGILFCGKVLVRISVQGLLLSQLISIFYLSEQPLISQVWMQ